MPEELGRYRLIEAIGSGGMATVFAAEHAALHRQVAIKVLHPHLTDDPGMARRIVREARMLAALRHPGIVEVIDVGVTTDGRTYLVMERLAGEPLNERLNRGRLVEERTVVFARQLASALEVAHAAGVIHRDLKPDNVFVVPDPDVPGGERVKLLDFGIAKRTMLVDDGERTRSGVVLGTPAYMAPEQCTEGATVDARADVYALGVLIYRMVTGVLPFGGNNTAEMFAEHAYCAPTPAATLAPVSAELSAIIDRCLAKEPDARFAGMLELGNALGAIASAVSPLFFEESPTAVDGVRAVPLEISSHDDTGVQIAMPPRQVARPILSVDSVTVPLPVLAPPPLPAPVPPPLLARTAPRGTRPERAVVTRAPSSSARASTAHVATHRVPRQDPDRPGWIVPLLLGSITGVVVCVAVLIHLREPARARSSSATPVATPGRVVQPDPSPSSAAHSPEAPRAAVSHASRAARPAAATAPTAPSTSRVEARAERNASDRVHDRAPARAAHAAAPARVAAAKPAPRALASKSPPHASSSKPAPSPTPAPAVAPAPTPAAAPTPSKEKSFATVAPPTLY